MIYTEQKNPVYVTSNASVKTTGYRYQNYAMNATYKGENFFKNYYSLWKLVVIKQSILKIGIFYNP